MKKSFENKKSKSNNFLSTILKFSLALAALFLLAFIVIAADVIVEGGTLLVGGDTLADTDNFYVDRDGNVGIGIMTPSQKLDVAGRVRMTEFQLGTAANPGDVLTADASGVGTWQAPAGGSGIPTGLYGWGRGRSNGCGSSGSCVEYKPPVYNAGTAPNQYCHCPLGYTVVVIDSGHWSPLCTDRRFACYKD